MGTKSQINALQHWNPAADINNTINRGIRHMDEISSAKSVLEQAVARAKAKLGSRGSASGMMIKKPGMWQKIKDMVSYTLGSIPGMIGMGDGFDDLKRTAKDARGGHHTTYGSAYHYPVPGSSSGIFKSITSFIEDWMPSFFPGALAAELLNDVAQRSDRPRKGEWKATDPRLHGMASGMINRYQIANAVLQAADVMDILAALKQDIKEALDSSY
jgi:hypothetical protein